MLSPDEKLREGSNHETRIPRISTFRWRGHSLPSPSCARLIPAFGKSVIGRTRSRHVRLRSNSCIAQKYALSESAIQKSQLCRSLRSEFNSIPPCIMRIWKRCCAPPSRTGSRLFQHFDHEDRGLCAKHHIPVIWKTLAVSLEDARAIGTRRARGKKIQVLVNYETSWYPSNTPRTKLVRQRRHRRRPKSLLCTTAHQVKGNWRQPGISEVAHGSKAERRRRTVDFWLLRSRT